MIKLVKRFCSEIKFFDVKLAYLYWLNLIHIFYILDITSILNYQYQFLISNLSKTTNFEKMWSFNDIVNEIGIILLSIQLMHFI